MDERDYIKKNEVQEIRDVAKIIFDGGCVSCDAAIEDAFKKWQFFIQIFLIIIHPKHGYFVMLPCSGAPLEQPYKTMQIMNVLRDLWIEKIKAENERAMRR